jgi:hypothetical protein
MRIAGASNFGTAESGIGIAGSEPFADTFRFVIPGGRRLMSLLGTIYL